MNSSKRRLDIGLGRDIEFANRIIPAQIIVAGHFRPLDKSDLTLPRYKTRARFVDRFIRTMGDKDSRDLKVLLVEDVEDTRLFMRLELEGHGFIVLEAADGRTAVDLAAKESPDVILMDLTLPTMDGFSAAKLIRKKNEKLSHVPIIAVTAHQETDFRDGAKASGFDAYVTKPIDIPWLKELINGLLM